MNLTPTPRVIAFAGGTNFRELGGYPAADGRRIRHGLLYRGGKLYDLKTLEDRNILTGLGLKLIVDLRSEGERNAMPDYIPGGARYLPISAMRYDSGEEVDFSPEGMKRLEKEFSVLTPSAVTDFLETYYARMPFHNPAFQAIFKAMEEDEVPLLFHCTSGKDRTGIAAMLILLALGASRETAIADYLETNRCRAEEFRKLEAARGSLKETHPEEWELLVIGFGVLQKFIEAALDAIIERYGTWDAYFESEFGLDRQRLQNLRDKYLE